MQAKLHTCQPTQAALAAWAKRQGLVWRKTDYGEIRIGIAAIQDHANRELAAAYVDVRDWARDWLDVMGTAKAQADWARANLKA